MRIAIAVRNQNRPTAEELWNKGAWLRVTEVL